MMHLGAVILRHMTPMMAMLEAAIRECPAEAWQSEGRIAVGEHAYHCLYFLERRLHGASSSYELPPFHDEDAAMLRGPSALELDKNDLLRYVNSVREQCVARLSLSDRELLVEELVQGKPFSLVDCFLTHLRHVQHHTALIYRLVHDVAAVDLPWRSYLWG